jgi:hypothetical protein
VSTSITEFGTVKLPIEKTGQLNLTKWFLYLY